MKPNTRNRALVLIVVMIAITVLSINTRASSTGTCSGQMITIPFDDVLPGNVFFCSIAEVFFSGLSNGTDATHYSPSANVSREQMAAFVTRTLDQSLRRGSDRAALDQFWTTQGPSNLGITAVASGPYSLASDGTDIWVSSGFSNMVSRVRASDGKLLGTWTGAVGAGGVVSAAGKVFVLGQTNSIFTPGTLYQIDPTQPPGAVTTLTSSLGGSPHSMAYDGQRIWTSNADHSVSIVTLNPISVTNVSTGFANPAFLVYDGTNMWVGDEGDQKFKKLDSNGAILQSVAITCCPQIPAFDGTNIWVPQYTNPPSVDVIRASTGTLITQLTGNGLNGCWAAAFDGERILVTNTPGDSVSLWRASDLTPIGTFSLGAGSFPKGACSDGLNFWIALPTIDASVPGRLARF